MVYKILFESMRNLCYNMLVLKKKVEDKVKKYYNLIICGLLVAFILAGCGEEPASHVVNTASPVSGSGADVSPQPTVKPLTEDEILTKSDDILSKMTLEQKIGQLFIVTPEQLDTSKKQIKGMKKVTQKLGKTMEKYPVGGILLTQRNLNNVRQAKQFCAALQNASPEIPLYIAADEEGGKQSIFKKKAKLGAKESMSQQQMGETLDQSGIVSASSVIARNIKELGFNLNLGLVADLVDIDNPSNASRCFAEDDETVGDCVSSYIAGSHQLGVATAMKCFPGEGSVKGNKAGEVQLSCDKSLSHLRKYDFTPFWSGIKAGTDMIMVSSVSVPNITQDSTPAFMSSLIVKGILRDELLYDDIAISSLQNSKALTKNYTADQIAIQSILAGCDVILSPSDLPIAFNGVKSAVKNGKIGKNDLDASVLRVLHNKIQRGIIAFQ